MLLYIVIGIVSILLLALCFFLGYQYRKRNAEKEIGSAEQEATRILNEALKSAESKKREALVEAREEIHRERSSYEQEVKERRSELSKQERRLQSKEENLDRKTDAIEKKEEKLQNRIAAADRTREETEQIKQAQLETLEKISGLSTEEAKNYLINQVEAEVTHEEAMKIKEIKDRFKDEAAVYAREMIAMAIQRCAADQVSEVAVSVVPLPNDEMKGRIIGREGRNIRTLETLTGAELIIDDTPEAITVSCYDPIRREITRIALERLITDGRIHPARIEEMVEKAKREVEQVIKAEGERAVLETNIHSLHPEEVKLLGRMHYRTSYGQNVLNHSIEVSHIAGLLASELGADVATAKRACSTTWARPWTTRSRAAMSRSAWTWPGATRRTSWWFTPSPLTTGTSSPRPSSPAWSRPPTPSPPPVPAHAARTWRTISSVWKSWRPSPPPSRAWTTPTPSRPAAKSAS